MAPIAMQRWSAKRYAEAAHFVPALGATALELLAPSTRERILDLGCGDGVLSQKIVEAGARVVAVDAAPRMVAAAQARAIASAAEWLAGGGSIAALLWPVSIPASSTAASCWCCATTRSVAPASCRKS
jgi:SAM-dependent methyltransferase